MTDAELCDCPLEGETPSDVDRCFEEKEFQSRHTGTYTQICSRPAGHDGPHAACTVAEHPAEVWDR